MAFNFKHPKAAAKRSAGFKPQASSNPNPFGVKRQILKMRSVMIFTHIESMRIVIENCNPTRHGV